MGRSFLFRRHPQLQSPDRVSSATLLSVILGFHRALWVRLCITDRVKWKGRAAISSSPSPSRLQLVMHKKSKQDNDLEGATQQPQQCASSESHGYSPFVFQTNNSLDLKKVPGRPHGIHLRTIRLPFLADLINRVGWGVRVKRLPAGFTPSRAAVAKVHGRAI